MTDAIRTLVDDLVALLDLEPLELNLFRGAATREEGWRRVYGGQVIAQALMAAIRTVDPDRPCHSLHAYFIRAGDPAIPIVYTVDRDRDGKSFSTRRVVAIQHGQPIFNMACSFQVVESGPEHQLAMPDVVGPEDLLNEQQLRAREVERIPEKFRAHWLRDRPIEIRPIAPRDMLNPGKGEPVSHSWFRIAAPVGDAAPLNQGLLAYASDMTLLDTCLLPHGISWLNPKMQTASLDHAIWFHAPFRVDEWLLYAQDSPNAHGARGLNRGSIYTRDGRLVASVAQEGLIRVHP